jgi:hypothetical protein
MHGGGGWELPRFDFKPFIRDKRKIQRNFSSQMNFVPRAPRETGSRVTFRLFPRRIREMARIERARYIRQMEGASG